MLKFFFDRIVALLIVILFSPFFILLAIMIKLDSKGPIFYRQIRVGQYGQEFRIFKFRSMIVNEGNSLTAGDQDSRITRVGYWIRKLHLDEFAQTLNVLKGEMSLVGPRPEVPEFMTYYPHLWQEVLKFKPGITGLAAIKCADFEYKMLENSLDPKQTYISQILPRKLRYDRFYTHHYSFKFDCLIMFKTILVIFKQP